MTTAENIDVFCAYFERQIAAIERVVIAGDVECGVGSEFRFRKVLCVTAIDALAGLRYHRSAYPQLARQNCKRFTLFVEEHGSWSEGSLVSLPFLLDELEKLKLLQSPLGQRIVAKLSAFSTQAGGSYRVAEIDEPVAHLLAHATTEKEKKAIYDYQHLALLYRYRNNLVHESREPGTAMEVFANGSDPYYHGYIGDAKWYLAYPHALFGALLQRLILSFRAYLTKNSIDPFSLVEDRARW